MRAFLNYETTTRVAISDRRSFHEARNDITKPNTGAPSPYSIVNEIDQRVDLAREAQQVTRDFASADFRGPGREIWAHIPVPLDAVYRVITKMALV